MGKMGNVNFKQLQNLQKKLQQAEKQTSQVIEKIINDIADEFLQEVIDRTPNTDSNKLKNNWKKRIVSKGSNYIVEVYNDIEYASNVEYGSRTADNGWNEGKFMMTITQQDIERRMQKIGQPTLDTFLQGVFK